MCTTGPPSLLLATTVSPLDTSPSWPTSLAHSLAFLSVLRFWTLSLTLSRRPGSHPRTRQPLWWNDACCHDLVARNGSWRDFRRSGSLENQARFCLLRQQFHSTVRSSRTRLWNEWLGSVTSLSRRAPRLACSLIRRTFRSSGVTPDLCHMQWHRGAFPLARPFFLPNWGLNFSDDFFHSVSLYFASLTSLHDSGRFDAPFSYTALSKCHECTRRGVPPILTLQSLFPLVASSSAFLLQPCSAPLCGSVRLDVQPCRSHFS